MIKTSLTLYTTTYTKMSNSSLTLYTITYTKMSNSSLTLYTIRHVETGADKGDVYPTTSCPVVGKLEGKDELYSGKYTVHTLQMFSSKSFLRLLSACAINDLKMGRSKDVVLEIKL